VSSPFQHRFGEAVDAYVAYRPEYPPELFGRILAAVPADHRNRAIDLGAGTGKFTRPLLGHFAELIAVEPDPLMAEKLRASDSRIVVRVTTAEECMQEPASVDLVNVATALHWMDVPRVMANVVRWLRPGGVLAVCAGGFPQPPKPVQAIIRQEFDEHWNRFRDPRLDTADSSEYVIREVRALRILDHPTIPNTVHLTPHDFAGFWRSTSYGNAYARSLADPEAYWRDLESRLGEAWPDEKFPVDFNAWLVLAKKD
jgi:SAM-dependent methyltransferase